VRVMYDSGILNYFYNFQHAVLRSRRSQRILICLYLVIVRFRSIVIAIILLIIYFLVFNTFSVRRYIFLSWYYTNSTSFSFTYTVLLLCYFAIIFVKYPMARGAWEERKTILSRMNVRIIGEEPSIILLGHRDKLDKREFRNYHSKPGHDSSLLPRSWDSSGIV